MLYLCVDCSRAYYSDSSNFLHHILILSQMTTAKSVASGGLYEAKGHGVIVTNDGDMVNWTGHGIGCTNGLRGASFRGARFYRTGSQKLARFNGLVAVFEVEIDNDGNVLEKFWQWR
jgi:hypothetical protein